MRPGVKIALIVAAALAVGYGTGRRRRKRTATSEPIEVPPAPGEGFELVLCQKHKERTLCVWEGPPQPPIPGEPGLPGGITVNRFYWNIDGDDIVNLWHATATPELALAQARAYVDGLFSVDRRAMQASPYHFRAIR